MKTVGRPSCRQCGGSGRMGSGVDCWVCWDVTEQARDWLALRCESPRRAENDPQDSHAVMLGAANVVVNGFALSGELAFALLSEYACRSDRGWSENELRRKLSEAERGAKGARGGLIFKRHDGTYERGAAKVEEAGAGEKGYRRGKDEFEKALPFDRAALEAVQVRGLVVDRAYLRERSSRDVLKMGVEDFLEGLYGPGERVLVFNRFRSQGQFCYEVGVGWYRLGERPGESSQRMDGGPVAMQREGVWYLCQPVSGRWVRKQDGSGELTRRDWQGVTAWRYMVVESDEKEIEGMWLNALVQLRLPIVALYSSGGKSVHALIRVNAGSKEEWEQVRGVVRPVLTRLGADRAVFSGVRLTRLPFFLRQGTDGKDGYVRFPKPRLQELLYFAPEADGRPIMERVVRGV